MQRSSPAPKRTRCQKTRSIGSAVFLSAAIAVPCAAVPLEELMPPAERRVVTLVPDYAAQYKAAANELQKSTVWKSRTAAIKSAINPQKGEPKGAKWVGVLESMTTTSKGNAVVTVRISPIIVMATHPVELLDLHKTLIKNGSPDYLILSQLKVGDVIKFAPAFDTTGSAITEAGNMESPRFSTRFSRIEAVPGASRQK